MLADSKVSFDAAQRAELGRRSAVVFRGERWDQEGSSEEGEGFHDQSSVGILLRINCQMIAKTPASSLIVSRFGLRWTYTV